MGGFWRLAVSSLIAAAVLASAASRAAAQDAEAGGALPERRVAVLVLAVGGVDPDVADSLTEVAIGAIAQRGGVSIVGKEEFQALLGQGEQGSAECIGSTPCLGRVGVELGVHELVAGTVGRRAAGWVFNLNRIDISSGAVIGRAYRDVAGDVGELAEAIQGAVPSLYEVEVRAGALSISASVQGAEVLVDGALVGVVRGGPVRHSGVAPGRHEVEVRASGHLPWRRTVNVEQGATLQLEAGLNTEPTPVNQQPSGVSPWVWIAGGLALTVAGAGAYFAVSSQGEQDNSDQTRSETIDYYDARETDALAANILFGAAGAVAVGGAILWLLGGDDDDDDGGEEATVARAGAEVLHGGGLVTLVKTF